MLKEGKNEQINSGIFSSLKSIIIKETHCNLMCIYSLNIYNIINHRRHFIPQRQVPAGYSSLR